MVKRRSRSKRRKSKQRRSRRKVSKKRVSKKRNSKRRSRRKVSKRNSKRRSRRRISKQKQDGGEVKYGDPTVGDNIRSVFRATAVPFNTVKDTAGMFIERAERGFRDNKYDMEARFSKKLGDLKTKITPKKGTAEITRARAACRRKRRKTRDKLRELRKAGKNISDEDEKLLDILNWGTITTGRARGNVSIFPCDKPEIACADNNRCVQNEYQFKQCVSDESIKKCVMDEIHQTRSNKISETDSNKISETDSNKISETDSKKIKPYLKLGSEKMFPKRK
jgi:hypothetical protein